MEFVYFFKHVNSPFVKIGMTKNDSIKKRLDAFSTYAPQGVINLGIIETYNATELESIIHKEYKELRAQGEFFRMDDEMVERIIEKYSLTCLNTVNILNIIPITWNVGGIKQNRKIIAIDNKGLFSELVNYYCVGIIVTSSTAYSSSNDYDTIAEYLKRFNEVKEMKSGLWYEVN